MLLAPGEGSLCPGKALRGGWKDRLTSQGLTGPKTLCVSRNRPWANLSGLTYGMGITDRGGLNRLNHTLWREDGKAPRCLKFFPQKTKHLLYRDKRLEM